MFHEQETHCDRLLKEKDQRYQQSLVDRELHLIDLHSSIQQQQLFLTVFAIVAGVIVCALAVVLCCMFQRQENDKRRLYHQYEDMVEEKTERIHCLERKQEEDEQKLANKMKLNEERNAAFSQLTAAQIVHTAPSPHPIFCTTPGMPMMMSSHQ